MCGGTGPAARKSGGCRGLSPRVRGNLRNGKGGKERSGSIPACAGEPMTVHPFQGATKVYPRVCGGTHTTSRRSGKPWGLSPRVRGNRGRRKPQNEMGRSIPACAGEPRRESGRPASLAVYPRVCGGTAPPAATSSLRRGLSPRVRGNPSPVRDRSDSNGSIPACAGEPAERAGAGYSVEVYPRVCGGTSMRPRTSRPGRGLSPRVRGNRVACFLESVGIGSIPACAGEPGRPFALRQTQTVYPRVCGGTILECS